MDDRKVLKTQYIKIRVTEEQKKKIQENAEKNYLSVSAYMVRLALLDSSNEL